MGQALKNDQRRGVGWVTLQAERPGQRRWWKMVGKGPLGDIRDPTEKSSLGEWMEGPK